MKIIVTFMNFLYHLQTMKQKLWTTFVMYLHYCIDKQLPEGRMRCKMSKFTLLESPILILGHGDGKTESLNNGFSNYYRLRELTARTKIRTKDASFVLLSFCFGSALIS